MKLGIIGQPGAGKRTVFEAITGIPNDDTNYQVDDRIGTKPVPDERVDFLSNMYQPKKTTYAKVEYYLPGSRTTKADSNKDKNAWTTLRNCDAFLHVIRNFKLYGQEDVSIQQDWMTMEEEMILTDLMSVEKRLERLWQDKQRGKKINEEEISLLQTAKELLEQNIPLRTNLEISQSTLLKGYAFVSSKPILILLNNEDDDMTIPDLNFMSNINAMIIRGKLEQELCHMDAQESKEFLEEFQISDSAMDRVILASYDLLGLISFFTVGDDEVKAWTIQSGIQADDAAGVIHTDFKKGFIRAEVLAYQDLIIAGSYPEARKKGTVRLEGKTYQVKDGDIIHFRFNV